MISDRFQAFVTHGSGKAFSVLGKSRVVRVTWTAPPRPPPPPPPPPATQGHYQGSSSFGETFGFDVSADGNSIVNLQTGQIKESCNPSDVTLSGGNLSFPGPIPIAQDGSFVINSTFDITIDFPDGSVVGSRTVSITGRFTGGTAAGTMRTDTSLNHTGTAYVCNSGDQTWTVSKA